MSADTAIRPLTADEEAEARQRHELMRTYDQRPRSPRDLTPESIIEDLMLAAFDRARLLATLDHERELRAEAVRSFAERVRREIEALPCYRPGCSCEDGPPLRSRVLALMGTESSGGSDLGSEYGRLLAERDRLVADGADPAELVVPLSPLAENGR